MLRKLLMVTSFPLNLLVYRRTTGKLLLLSALMLPVQCSIASKVLPDGQATTVTAEATDYDVETSDRCAAMAREQSELWSNKMGGDPVVFYENTDYGSFRNECYLEVTDMEGDGK